MEPHSSIKPYPETFETRAALAELPWFEIDHDEIVIADKSVGPIIDTHTHIAMPVIKPFRCDLEKETDSGLLLGPCCPHHLHIYANQNFSPSGLRALKRDLVLGGLFGIGKRKKHTVPNLTKDLKSMGITEAWALGIELFFPTFTVNQTLEMAKKYRYLTGFGSVYPKSNKAREHFEEQLHLGASGMKMHPANQLIPPDAEEMMKVYEWCGKERIPVFWHCGPAGIALKKGEEYTQVRLYEKPIATYPETIFVLGHAGALQSEEAVALQRKYPNTFLEISSISLPQMMHLIDNADLDRVFFGSDWPWYHPVLPLAKVLIATEGRAPEIRRKILYDNAARMMERVSQRIQFTMS